MRTAAQVEAVFRRLRRLQRNPPLFNDRVRPKAVRRRLERFRHWCGPVIWNALCTAECTRRAFDETSLKHRNVRWWKK